MPDAIEARMHRLVRFGAAAGVLGGLLRIASGFVPYQPEQAWLEALYGVIDVCLLFGLLGFYLASAEKLGVAGMALFAVALAGLASIVGPDAQMFGVDFYRVGALVFLVGLAGLSVQMLLKRQLVASAWLWIAALASSLAGAALQAPLGILGAGMLLGAGYVLAGLMILRPRIVEKQMAAA
ncbi:MAG: hypothetical protein Q8R02_12405 [Hyphomonadaceae bacterium]|nr:hypothetical protein [Hyphomonadaceae bacterium]